MPNYCTNLLHISTDNVEVQKAITSLLNGSILNRHREMYYKIRKIFLAGASGMLVPHSSVDERIYNQAIKKSSLLKTPRRMNTQSSLAYSEFLGLFVGGALSAFNYETIDRIYKNSGVHHIYFGDIPTEKRKKIKALWASCKYDYSGYFRTETVDKWWSHKSLVWDSTVKEGTLDFKILSQTPVHIIVNGFNAHFMPDSMSEYNFNVSTYGTKWEIVEIDNNPHWINKDSIYIRFDTAWSPALPLVDIVKDYLTRILELDQPYVEEEVAVHLGYFEAGCAFQGIDHFCCEYTVEYDEETDEYTEHFIPDVQHLVDMCEC